MSVKRIFISLYEPLFFPEDLRRGIDPALGERIATQNPPCPEQNPHDDAVVVDTSLGILGTRRQIETCMTGQMVLIKDDQKDAESLEIRSENRAAEITVVVRRHVKHADVQASFPFRGVLRYPA